MLCTISGRRNHAKEMLSLHLSYLKLLMFLSWSQLGDVKLVNPKHESWVFELAISVLTSLSSVFKRSNEMFSLSTGSFNLWYDFFLLFFNDVYIAMFSLSRIPFWWFLNNLYSDFFAFTNLNLMFFKWSTTLFLLFTILFFFSMIWCLLNNQWQFFPFFPFRREVSK